MLTLSVSSQTRGRSARLLVPLFFAAGLNAQIPAGSIGTIAGTGTNGYSDGGRVATAAQIDIAYNIAVDAWGNVYIADSWNHRIRQVAPDGSIKVLAGTGTQGFSGDGGQATSAALSFPRGLAVDAWGNVFFVDSGNNVIRKIQTTGVIQTVAGNRQVGYQGDGGVATQASFRVPRGLAVDARGNLYVADSFNARIRRVGTDGKVSTLAGTGQFGYSGDAGPAISANIGFVHSLALDLSGNLYLTDTTCHCVRRVRVDGVIETVAGTGQAGFSGDNGPAASAALNLPRGLALDQQGNIFVADSGNNRIRLITADANISSVVGTGSPGFGGDLGQASLAQINAPYGLTADARGNIYVVDLLNYRVRKARFESLQDAPSITQQSAVNGASFLPQMSPGGLISIFGNNFGYNQFSAVDLPLAPSLAGTSVIINGKPAPMILASPGQINAQLPWSVASSIKLKVNFGGVESGEVSVPVSSASPGIFVYGENRAVVQNQDFSLNTPENPASRGSSVVIYATGLGAVLPSQSDGTAAPASPLSRTSGATTVLIGNVPAAVSFSGLAPSFVGLWQVNAAVPANSPTGSTTPVKISVGGAASNEAMISVR